MESVQPNAKRPVRIHRRGCDEARSTRPAGSPGMQRIEHGREGSEGSQRRESQALVGSGKQDRGDRMAASSQQEEGRDEGQAESMGAESSRDQIEGYLDWLLTLDEWPDQFSPRPVSSLDFGMSRRKVVPTDQEQERDD